MLWCAGVCKQRGVCGKTTDDRFYSRPASEPHRARSFFRAAFSLFLFSTTKKKCWPGRPPWASALCARWPAREVREGNARGGGRERETDALPAKKAALPRKGVPASARPAVYLFLHASCVSPSTPMRGLLVWPPAQPASTNHPFFLPSLPAVATLARPLPAPLPGRCAPSSRVGAFLDGK